ncbi:autophagy-related protein [Lyophyllum atratum]|nr:autophagy-related protein [Lyophyllum atratum]
MASTTVHPIITIDLTLDRVTTRDVLTGVLQSILFHRLFGTVKPQTFEVLDVTMPGVSDQAIERLVDEKVNIFWKWFESGSKKDGQIIVTFAERRPKKSWFQVHMGEEEVPWEKWVVNAKLQQPQTDEDRQSFDADSGDTLTKAIETMLIHTSSERGRMAVPLITSQAELSPFPIQISVIIGGVEVG